MAHERKVWIVFVVRDYTLAVFSRAELKTTFEGRLEVKANRHRPGKAWPKGAFAMKNAGLAIGKPVHDVTDEGETEPGLGRHDQFTVQRHGYFFEELERPWHILDRETIRDCRNQVHVDLG